MPPDRFDMARLWDILDAAKTSIEFTAGMRYEDFIQDRRTRNAVERNLEVIGEAARCLSPATKDNFAEIPWKSMIGLRNVLAHEYGEIRYEVLWIVVIEKLPPLVEQLSGLGVDQPPFDMS